MNFPPFWARGESNDFFAWRWSFRSFEEAQALANQAALQVADRFRTGQLPPRHGGYYPDRPFREQILQRINNDRGDEYAVITRNSYGCQVLNTAQVMFVDIDLPQPKPSGGFFRHLFRRPEPEPAQPPPAQTEALARIENWTRSNSSWGWRIYRTRSGLRLLATQGLVEADSVVSNATFEALGADPLYRKLCKTQKCFRARLTPKPWRCGLYSKPARWPWLNPKAEQAFQKWDARYQEHSANWATCAFIRQLGNPTVDPAVQPLLTLHDRATRAESKLQLA